MLQPLWRCCSGVLDFNNLRTKLDKIQPENTSCSICSANTESFQFRVNFTNNILFLIGQNISSLLLYILFWEQLRFLSSLYTVLARPGYILNYCSLPTRFTCNPCKDPWRLKCTWTWCWLLTQGGTRSLTLSSRSETRVRPRKQP